MITVRFNLIVHSGRGSNPGFEVGFPKVFAFGGQPDVILTKMAAVTSSGCGCVVDSQIWLSSRTHPHTMLTHAQMEGMQCGL